MRIVFIGTVEFSLRALEYLLTLDAEIVGVCTLEQSKFNADHVDLTNFSAEHGIPSIYADDINSPESFNWIKSKSPDVIFCFGWSRLIKQDLLELAPLGIVGFHPAALPENRGRHPIIWALVLGLKKTASTFFFMNKDADSGDILSQQEVVITQEDDARTLYDKVVQTGLTQIAEFLPQLTTRSFQRIRQNGQCSNLWRKRCYLDGQIDWRMSAQSIYNLVRGLTKPYIGAHCLVDGKEIKVWKAAIVMDSPMNAEPGKVLQASGKSIVKCGVGAIALLHTDPELNVDLGAYL
jgi:methionyl-tRNA formyltransferase